eukprot:2887377-Pyramimonas_sp.AAC.1
MHAAAHHRSEANHLALTLRHILERCHGTIGIQTTKSLDTMTKTAMDFIPIRGRQQSNIWL